MEAICDSHQRRAPSSTNDLHNSCTSERYLIEIFEEGKRYAQGNYMTYIHYRSRVEEGFEAEEDDPPRSVDSEDEEEDLFDSLYYL
jgi:hypothetical protein